MKSLINIVLLAISFTASHSFSQKKNSISLQTGLFNVFYDTPTIVFNSNVKFNGKLRVYSYSKFIKSVGVKYERKINDKHSISLSVNNFIGFYEKVSNESPEMSKFLSKIDYRKWFFISTQYHYSFFQSKKINLTFGGGLIYRKGYEAINFGKSPFAIFPDGEIAYETHVEFLGKEDFGTRLDFGIKYNFWKNFFLHSEIDMQYYFYNKFKSENEKFNEKYNVFVPTKNINHTFTIGLGINF